MKNTIINISSIDPITQYEFIKQVLKEYDREPDFEYPVRLAIQDVFGIEFGKSIKEFIFRFPNDRLRTIFIGDKDDIDYIYEKFSDFTNHYWCHGRYPDECKFGSGYHYVSGIISYETLNNDFTFTHMIFIDDILTQYEIKSPWDYYVTLAEKLYRFKNANKEGYSIQYLYLSSILGYGELSKPPIDDFMKITDDLATEIRKGNWAKVVNIITSNHKTPIIEKE